ncbi:MAG: P-II family nitrogen regulator [Actinobacteria bacterium]|nr:P-II family nitrogen regulator [Actinomycetota bacterium]
MKLVTAILKPHKFDDVKEALKKDGITGLTVTEVKGFGRQGGKTETFRGSEYTVELLPKLKIELVVEESSVAKVVETITTAGQTGKIGDGKIWVLGVDELVRIRTSETGVEAI